MYSTHHIDSIRPPLMYSDKAGVGLRKLNRVAVVLFPAFGEVLDVTCTHTNCNKGSAILLPSLLRFYRSYLVGRLSFRKQRPVYVCNYSLLSGLVRFSHLLLDMASQQLLIYKVIGLWLSKYGEMSAECITIYLENCQYSSVNEFKIAFTTTQIDGSFGWIPRYWSISRQSESPYLRWFLMLYFNWMEAAKGLFLMIASSAWKTTYCGILCRYFNEMCFRIKGNLALNNRLFITCNSRSMLNEWVLQTTLWTRLQARPLCWVFRGGPSLQLDSIRACLLSSTC